MKLRNARTPVRPATRLGVEKLDDRVLPSAGVSLADSLPLAAPPAAEVQIAHFGESQIVEAMKKVKIDSARAFSIDTLGGLNGGVVGSVVPGAGEIAGGFVSISSRVKGEEIPT